MAGKIDGLFGLKRGNLYSDIELLTRWNEHKDYKARNELVLRYMPAVFKRAMRYSVNHLVNRYDLIQEGVLGLIKAVDKWDVTRSDKFFNCAYYYIMDAMYNLSIRYRSIASSYTLTEVAGDNFEDAIVNEITSQRIANIVDTECSERGRLGLAFYISEFGTDKNGLMSSQLQRGYSQAVEQVRVALRLKAPQVQRSPLRQLTGTQVGIVRTRLTKGDRLVDIAKTLGVRPKIISDIKRGISYIGV